MTVKLKNLNDQVVVITGASSGIGLATAEAVAEQGAKLVLAARSERALNDIVGRINAAGGEAIAVPCDVAERRQIDQVAERAVTRFGRIDTWVNNAGQGMYGRLDEVTEADSRRLFDVNFWGVVNGALAALPHLKKNGGALINVVRIGLLVGLLVPVRPFTGALGYAALFLFGRLGLQFSQLLSAAVLLVGHAFSPVRGEKDVEALTRQRDTLSRWRAS